MMESASRREFDGLLFFAFARLSREGVLPTLNYFASLDSYEWHGTAMPSSGSTRRESSVMPLSASWRRSQNKKGFAAASEPKLVLRGSSRKRWRRLALIRGNDYYDHNNSELEGGTRDHSNLDGGGGKSKIQRTLG